MTEWKVTGSGGNLRKPGGLISFESPGKRLRISSDGGPDGGLRIQLGKDTDPKAPNLFGDFYRDIINPAERKTILREAASAMDQFKGFGLAPSPSDTLEQQRITDKASNAFDAVAFNIRESISEELGGAIKVDTANVSKPTKISSKGTDYHVWPEKNVWGSLRIEKVGPIDPTAPAGAPNEQTRPLAPSERPEALKVLKDQIQSNGGTLPDRTPDEVTTITGLIDGEQKPKPTQKAQP